MAPLQEFDRAMDNFHVAVEAQRLQHEEELRSQKRGGRPGPKGLGSSKSPDKGNMKKRTRIYISHNYPNYCISYFGHPKLLLLHVTLSLSLCLYFEYIYLSFFYRTLHILYKYARYAAYSIYVIENI